MSRRRFLVTYDISDDKRRTTVFKTLFGFGDHIQYSVFVCELNRRENVELTGRLTRAINNREDQILFIDLGPIENDAGKIIASLGMAYETPTRTVVV